MKVENKKYRLTDHHKTLDDGRKVYQIEALVDFSDVKAGDLGGYVETERDLSHKPEDTSWIYDESIVAGNGHSISSFTVGENSVVRGDSYVDKGWIYGKSTIIDSTIIGSLTEETTIINSQVTDDADMETDYEQIQTFPRITGSEVRHIQLVKDSIIQNSSINATDEVKNAKVVHSLTVDTPVTDSAIYGSHVGGSSSVRDHSEITNAYLQNVEVANHSIVEDVRMDSGVIADRSEVFHSHDIKKATIYSSSLNSMDKVRKANFTNTHSQESTIDDTALVESNVQNSTITKGSKINHSDIRLSDIEASSINNTLLRSSSVKDETLDEERQTDYKTPEPIDQMGVYLDEEDLQDLSEDFFEL